MSEFKVGDQVCFLSGHSLPQFFGGVYEVVGQTIAGIFNDEYVLDDKGKNRRVSYKAIRHATPQEIAAGRRIDKTIGTLEELHPKFAEVLHDNFLELISDDSHIENHISPNCKVEDV